MNLPNKLRILRMILIVPFVACMLIPGVEAGRGRQHGDFTGVSVPDYECRGGRRTHQRAAYQKGRPLYPAKWLWQSTAPRKDGVDRLHDRVRS